MRENANEKFTQFWVESSMILQFGKILQVSNHLTQQKLLTTSNITNSPLNTKDAACMFCTLSSQSQRWIIVLFQHMIQNYSNMMRAGGGGGQTSGTPPSQPPSSSQEASNWKGPSWCWLVLAASNSEYSWMFLNGSVSSPAHRWVFLSSTYYLLCYIANDNQSFFRVSNLH